MSAVTQAKRERIREAICDHVQCSGIAGSQSGCCACGNAADAVIALSALQSGPSDLVKAEDRRKEAILAGAKAARALPKGDDSPTSEQFAQAIIDAALPFLALPALQREVPDGWQLVPKEPTPEMIQAACDATFGPHPMAPEDMHGAGYRAMLAACIAEERGP